MDGTDGYRPSVGKDIPNTLLRSSELLSRSFLLNPEDVRTFNMLVLSLNEIALYFERSGTNYSARRLLALCSCIPAAQLREDHTYLYELRARCYFMLKMKKEFDSEMAELRKRSTQAEFEGRLSWIYRKI